MIFQTLGRKIWAYYKKMEAREHPLLYIFFEITRKCNLSCLHCGSDCSASKDTPELSAESWSALAGYISRHFGNQVRIVITGGEPLMNPHLGKIVQSLKNAGLSWGMVTNGILLSEPVFSNLREKGLESITISLDGGKKSHELLRNSGGSFDQAIRAIRMVGKSDLPNQDIVTCASPLNLDELDLIAEQLMDLNISHWRLFRIFPSGRVKDHPELTLSFPQTHRLLEWIRERRPHYLKKGLYINYGCEGFMNYYMDRKIRSTPFFCRAGVNIASILCDGSITGCSNNAPAFYEGNVITDDFAKIWENGFKDFRDRKWAKKGPCLDCKTFKECGGSSIHLWANQSEGPAFCYLKDIQISS